MATDGVGVLLLTDVLQLQSIADAMSAMAQRAKRVARMSCPFVDMGGATV
ncbi:MAG: hypothetical protein WCP28_21820 [Actinomycetes bacterium]